MSQSVHELSYFLAETVKVSENFSRRYLERDKSVTLYRLLFEFEITHPLERGEEISP